MPFPGRTRDVFNDPESVANEPDDFVRRDGCLDAHCWGMNIFTDRPTNAILGWMEVYQDGHTQGSGRQTPAGKGRVPRPGNDWERDDPGYPLGSATLDRQADMRRSTALGYAIAPPLGPLVWGIIVLFNPDVTTSDEFGVGAWVISITFFSLLSYLACLIFGAPLLRILNRMNKLSFWWITLFGASLYAFSVYIVLMPIPIWLGVAEVPGSYLLTAVYTSLVGFGLGSLVSAAFCWLAGIRARPRARMESTN